MAKTIDVHSARPSEAPRLAAVLAAAYGADPVWCWLVPCERERHDRLLSFFNVLVEHVLRFGTATTTEQRDAVALWLEVCPKVSLLPDHHRLHEVLGEVYWRYYKLHRLTDAIHPYGAQHVFAPFIGVVPDRQGQGAGTALVQHKLAASGLPVYLEATSSRNRKWCERLGFWQLPMRALLPDGPEVWSMWRSDRTRTPIPAQRVRLTEAR